MQLYSKNGLLIVVQVDHLSGEDLGDVIDRFYEAGAKNVQVVSSITKKNRPAYMIFIDLPLAAEEKVENIIVNELHSSGWHRIETCHRHTNVSVVEKQIRVTVGKESFMAFVHGKVINDDYVNVRPEYEDCRMIKDTLMSVTDRNISVTEIRQSLTELFRNGSNTLKF